MPKLFRWIDDCAVEVEDPFTNVIDSEFPPKGEVIVSLQRFLNEGERLLAEGRLVGVRVEAAEAVEDLEVDLPRISVIALVLPRFSDGRAYTSARILRQRLGYKGYVRAVGDVLREQARYMVRCGFDAFEPADNSTPEEWTHAVHRFRHVYQRGADALEPAFKEREGA
jgi:uncharacterized protein (DUF934 family)